MNPLRLVTLVIGSLAAALLVFLPVVFMRQRAADRAARRVMKHFGKTVEALKDYSSEQRDKALEKAKKSLEELDSRIEGMEDTLYEKWDQMDQEARNTYRSNLNEFRKQRNQIAEWYGAMKNSSENAWEDMKAGFINSYRELQSAFDKAMGQF